MGNNVLICIPARYASTRLPAKPLAKIAGVEMIQRVANIAKYVCEKNQNCDYIVATDDQRILDFCQHKQIPVTLSSENCNSGTERCWDVVSKMKQKPDFILNLQGDNPLCPPWFMEALIKEWHQDKEAQVFTPTVQLSWDELDTLRENKKTTPFSGTSVIMDKRSYALAFSKNIIPAIRKEEKMRAMSSLSPVFLHIGLYAYTYEALQQYFEIEPSPYEMPEGLEQMRFLHHAIPVKMVAVDYQGRQYISGIDSQEDIERAEKMIAQVGELDLSAR